MKSLIFNKRNTRKRITILGSFTFVCLIHISILYFLCTVAKHILSLEYVTGFGSLDNCVIEWLGTSAGRKICTTWIRPKSHKKELNKVQNTMNMMTNSKISKKYGRPTFWDPTRWNLVTKLQPWGYCLDSHYPILNATCQTVGTLNVQRHSLEWLNTLTAKCFRRRVWETRHSGVTGWELLSHFSDVWCSSALQLTMGSNLQRESLFQCQMWPWWMYVSNNVIT